MHYSQVQYTRTVKKTPPTEKKLRPEDACKMYENDLQVRKPDTDFQITGAESITGDMRDDEKILEQLACAEVQLID